MDRLEYNTDRTGRQGDTYDCVYNCNKCPYSTKSIFFMRNHARQHKLPLQTFDCQKNYIEVFFCKECRFRTYQSNYFNNHIKVHHSTKQEAATVKQTELVSRSYKCDKCTFQTCSALMWLKHSIYCQPDNAVEIKREDKFEGNEGENTDVLPKENTNVLPKMKEKLAKKHKCGQCPYAVTTLNQLKKHKLVHLPWLKCDKCRYKTKMENSLRLHHKVHLKVPKWFQCPHCDLKTKIEINLNTHILYRHKQDDPDKWLQCDQCTFKTLYSGSLKLHSRKHKTDKKELLKCPFCDLETEKQDLLDVHILYLHHQVPAKWDNNNREGNLSAKQPELANKCFKCPHCCFKTERQRLLNTHIMYRHKTVSAKSQIKKRVKKTQKKQVPKKSIIIQCKKCSFRALSNQDLKNHVAEAHTTVPVVPTVDKVNKKSACKLARRKSQNSGKNKTSLDKPNYNCEQCPEVFGKEVDLRIHTKLAHPGLHPLRCDVCLKQFGHKSGLIRHLKEQHIRDNEVEWFACSKCSYKAKRKGTLTSHQRSFNH